MLLLKLFGRVVNYVLTLGIIGFGWYQDPKLVKAAFQWNASLLEKATDRFNPSGHVEGILLAMNADKMLLFAEIMLLLSFIGGLIALVGTRLRHHSGQAQAPSPWRSRASDQLSRATWRPPGP
jgi:hypothetical protein